MNYRPITANPSQVMVEQLAACGINYVFYNSGSREARFFNTLSAHKDINGILALHEGSVTAMAGGYTQVNNDVAVMVVHLGAGLAQAMGQLINVWAGSLPVVIITFAGDTGSFGDTIGLDLSHNFGPTSIVAPMTKANWTVIEPEGLPAAIERAIRVAKTPPVGPVHLAVYDRLLSNQQVSTQIVESGVHDSRAGYPSDSDMEEVAIALHEADRPLIYVGDGIWKSGAAKIITELAERFGTAVASGFGDLRGVPIKHPQHAGRIDEAAKAIDPDLIVSIGARHSGAGISTDYSPFMNAKKTIAIGSDVENLKNMPGLDLAILADERRSGERLYELIQSETTPERYNQRRDRMRKHAMVLRSNRRTMVRAKKAEVGRVRPWALINALDAELERIGGGIVTIEQFAVPQDTHGGEGDPGNNVYIRPAGGSEGYGVGSAIGTKLAAPNTPVVGLVGDGSVYYADSGMWTAVHHRIPVLYVVPNNQAYGIVASAFSGANDDKMETGEYEGVVLEGMDPVKIAEGFGVEASHVTDEETISTSIANGLETVQRENRPYLLNVHLPLGLPTGGRKAPPFKLKS